MGRPPKFPMVVREGSVVVRIYRCAAHSARGGFAHIVSWVGAEGRERESIVDFEKAKEFAGNKARALAQGVGSSALATRGDFIELQELRDLAQEHGASALGALREWSEARRLTGDELLAACRDWAARPHTDLLRIGVKSAVAKFIAEKERLGKQGERVYGSKLKYAAEHFAERRLDAIMEEDWATFLEKFEDPVTRNDVRKRCVTLCRWARKRRHLPRLLSPTIENTERAKEHAKPIGIITAATLRRLLEFFQGRTRVQHLGALVLANFCGLRVEEIHGKRGDEARRQKWDDIHLDRGFLSVTAAKENTPSNRIVHLTAAATAWLRLVIRLQGWGSRKPTGYVAEVYAITYARKHAKAEGLKLPKNCFRHAWISYRIALTGNKAETATEAGNSVKEIDRRYRVPLPRYLGEEWFNTLPVSGGAATARRRRGHSG